MTCSTIRYADHAVIQMDARDISLEDVEIVISLGVKIANYPTDKPYPSCLLLGFIGKLPSTRGSRPRLNDRLMCCHYSLLARLYQMGN